MSIENRLNELTKRIRSAENLKLQAETRYESLQEQYLEINKEFEKMGIKPENAQAEKERIENEMQELEQQINEQLPHDVVEKYK